MTRETKIGLLVGLAFIIVIGILLSDHMTSTTEPQKAPLSVVGSNVRESIVTPAAPHSAPPVAAVGGFPGGQAAVAPNQPVNIGGDLSQPQRVAPPVAVNVGPAAPQAQPPVVLQQAPQAQSPVQTQLPPQIQVPQNPAQVTQGGNPASHGPVILAPPQPQPQPTHPLQRLANRHGEQIVPLGTPDAGETIAPPATVRHQPVPMAPLREYKAQFGDSLSKLAVRFMGSNSKANRDAIVRVNPTLQQNPDKIVEGRTYILPPVPAPDPEIATAPPAAPSAPTPAASAPENFSWYTVKENENLWKIASEQLGSGNAWTQIRDLNQDILKGDTQVRVNTRIRIPNRPVASAQ